MSLKAGIIGLPNVGKSTLFNALCKTKVEAANYPFATISPNTGVVSVPDPRLDYLSALFKPKKTVPAAVEFFDIAGLVKGASHGEGLGNKFLAHIRECDALVEVVRAFDDPAIINVEESVDPRRDIDIINIELCLADLASVEKRIATVEGKAKVGHDKTALYEMNLLPRLKKALEEGKAIRLLDLRKEDRDFINGNYHLLTLKPLIYVANVSEQAYQDIDHFPYYAAVKEIADREGSGVIAVSCAIESELADLSSAEKKELLAGLGAKESGLDKLIRAAYKLLDLATFFTVGPDECRAWTFREGTLAPQCAGIVHSDFERGFIKAEVYSFEDIVKYGSELAVREAGKLRLEGKAYAMQDGDIAFFRFSV